MKLINLFVLFILTVSITSDCFSSNNNNNNQENNVLDSYQQVEALYFNPNLININIKQLEKNLPTISFKLSDIEKSKNKAYKACLSLKGQGSLNLKPEDAFKYIQEYAQKLGKEKGDPFIVYALASLYENGVGIKKNLEKAITLYALAHNFGSQKAKEAQGRALNLLGVSYMLGKDVEKDEKKAAELFRQGLDLENTTASYNLGRCYEEGKGVEQNFLMAFKLYKTLSISKNSKTIEALFKLAEFYRDGKGVEKDSIQAINFYSHVETLLDENQTDRKMDCYFNLGRLYHQENPYNIELLEEAIRFYEKAHFLKHPTVLQHLEICKKDLICFQDLIKSLENLGSLDEKIKNSLLINAPKLFSDDMDKNDKLNILQTLNGLKDAREIEEFGTCLKNLFDHPSFPKFTTKNFFKIQMIQGFSKTSLDKLEIVLKNSSILFTPKMTWQEILDIVHEIDKIKDLEQIELALSFCPNLFIKIKISSSENDLENNTVQVLNKVQDMDGNDRAHILKALGKLKIENFPMAFLCVNTILNSHTKPIDIINAIDSVREILQPEKQEINKFEIREKDEDSHQNLISPIDINKIPVILPLISKFLNGTETIEEKIQFFNEIGKVELYQIEKFVGNSLKLTLKKMSVNDKIAIFQSLQGDKQEDFEKIIPYILKMIKGTTNGYVIAEIFNIFKEIGDIEKIGYICSSFEKAKLDLSDEQKPIMLKILSKIPDEEKENFASFSQPYLINKGMLPKETEEILKAFKTLSAYKRKALALFIKEKKLNSEEQLSILSAFHELESTKENFECVLGYGQLLIKKIKYNNFNEYLDYLIPIFKELNTIKDLKNLKIICVCADKFKKDNIKELVSILDLLKNSDAKKLSYLEKLPYENAFKQDSLEIIENGLLSFNKIKNEQLEKILPSVSRLVTLSTTWKEVAHLFGIFDDLTLKGIDEKDIFSFISVKQSKLELSGLNIFQALEAIEDPKILTGVLKNKSCLEMMDSKMDVHQIMDIFNMTYDIPEIDLQRVASYISLFTDEKMTNEQKSEIIKKLIDVKPNELQTTVFHVFLSLTEKATTEEIFKSFEKISNDLSENPKFILKEIIPAEEFVIYAKFSSKIYSQHNDYMDIRNRNEILQLLLRAKDPNRFKILLQDYPDHLEKIFKKNRQWFDLYTSNPLFYQLNTSLEIYPRNTSLENLKMVLSKTLEFTTDDMKQEDIMSVFEDIHWCVNKDFLEEVLLETNNFITKDMNGKNKRDVLYTITRSIDKKKSDKLPNFLKTVRTFMTEETVGDMRCEILNTIFRMGKKSREKLITYAPYALELISKDNHEMERILSSLIKYEEEKLKKVYPYILEMIELEANFYKKHNYKNDHSIPEKLEIFAKIAENKTENHVEKICDPVKKMAKMRYEWEKPMQFTGTSSLNPLLEIFSSIDTDKHDKILLYTFESEKIYQEYHKENKRASSMGDTLEELGRVSPEHVDRVFSFGKEYIKIKTARHYTNYGHSHIASVFDVFAKIKEEKDFDPIHSFTQLCIHNEMDRNQALSIVRCLGTKILPIPEKPSQYLVEGLKTDDNVISEFLYLFDPTRYPSSDTIYYDEIVPYTQELRKFSIGHEEYTSFEKESLFFNGELLENINKMYRNYREYSKWYPNPNETLLTFVYSNILKTKEINGFCLIGILKAINNFHNVKCNVLLTDEINRILNGIQKAFDFLNEEIFSKSENLIHPNYLFFRKKASDEKEIHQSYEIFTNIIKNGSFPLENDPIFKTIHKSSKNPFEENN